MTHLIGVVEKGKSKASEWSCTVATPLHERLVDRQFASRHKSFGSEPSGVTAMVPSRIQRRRCLSEDAHANVSKKRRHQEGEMYVIYRRNVDKDKLTIKVWQALQCQTTLYVRLSYKRSGWKDWWSEMSHLGVFSMLIGANESIKYRPHSFQPSCYQEQARFEHDIT